MRLYTGKGDQGGTDLLGARVLKSDPRIELIGTLDETTSLIGFARSLAGRAGLNELMIEVQRELYLIMAELAFTDELRPEAYNLGADRVQAIADRTDELSNEIELPRQFVVPGETTSGAAFDVARTVARRAERIAVGLSQSGQLRNEAILGFLNRLSSLLFMCARAEDSVGGGQPLRAKKTRDV